MSFAASIPIDPEVYMDIAYYPDPFTVPVPLCITNSEPRDLYFKARIDNPPPGWLVTEAELGLIQSGARSCLLARFTRQRPPLAAGEYTEQVEMVVEAYTNSSYTSLYGYQRLQLTINFVDHSDPAWTIIYWEDFDNVALGFTATTTSIDPVCSGGTSASLYTLKYLSAPHSLHLPNITGHIYKRYSIGAGYAKALMTLHVYPVYQPTRPPANLTIQINGVTVKPCEAPVVNNRWQRLTFPLAVNTVNTVRFGVANDSVYLDDIIVFAK